MRKVRKPSGSPTCSGTPAAIWTPSAANARPLCSASLVVCETTTPGASKPAAATLGKPRATSASRTPRPSAA